MDDERPSIFPKVSDESISKALSIMKGVQARRDAEIVDLGKKRAPVVYTVSICQGWDGSLSVQVHDIQDDPRSRAAVSVALRDAAKLIEDAL